MPGATQIPWYYMVAQWGQIISFIILPIFLVGSIAVNVLLYLKLGKVAKLLSGETVKAVADEGENPDISGFVE